MKPATISDIVKVVNRDFLIRVTNPSLNVLVSLQGLADMFSVDLASHLGRKVLRDLRQDVIFHRKGTTIAFLSR